VVFKKSIQTSSDVRLKISRGEISDAAAYIKKKYKVSGQHVLLMRLAKRFSVPLKG
jgi:hypothetical protein